MKYLLYNDVSYLLNKKRILIITIFIVPLLLLLININASSSMIDTIMSCTGTNLNLESIDIIHLIMYLFNVFSFIYLIVDIYIKDLNKNLENIFLRMSPIEYIVKKNLFFVISISIIKLIQYCIMILFLMTFGQASFNIDIFQLAMMDIIYILLIQYIFLLLYICFILMKKNIIFLSIMSIILLAIFPKCVWETRMYVILMIAVIVLVHIMINLIFLKKSKMIIENL